MQYDPRARSVIAPTSIDEAKMLEAKLVADLKHIDDQLAEAKHHAMDSAWKNRAITAKRHYERDLIMVRAWMKSNSTESLDRKELLRMLKKCAKTLNDINERGVALTDQERELIGELQAIHLILPAVPKNQWSRRLEAALSAPDADILGAVRQLRDVTSLQESAFIGYELFSNTEDARDLQALRNCADRATRDQDTDAMPAVFSLLAMALCKKGQVDQAIEVAHRIQHESRLHHVTILFIAQNAGRHELLKEVRESAYQFIGASRIAMWTHVYGVSGDLRDLRDAYQAAKKYVTEQGEYDEHSSGQFLVMLEACLVHNEHKFARSLVTEIKLPEQHALALAKIAQTTKSPDDLSQLLQFLHQGNLQIRRVIIVRQVISACLACGNSAAAQALADTLEGTMRWFALSVIARETTGPERDAALAAARKALTQIDKPDSDFPHAAFEMGCALATAGQFHEARKIAGYINISRLATKIWLAIYQAERDHAAP